MPLMAANGGGGKGTTRFSLKEEGASGPKRICRTEGVGEKRPRDACEGLQPSMAKNLERSEGGDQSLRNRF